MGARFLTFLGVLTILSTNGYATSRDETTGFCVSLLEGLGVYNNLNLLASEVWFPAYYSPQPTFKCATYIFGYNSSSSTLNILITEKSINSTQMQSTLLYTQVQPNESSGFQTYTVYYPSGETWIYQFLDISRTTVTICGYESSNQTNTFGLVLSSAALSSLPQGATGWYIVDESCYNSAIKMIMMPFYWMLGTYFLLIIFNKLL